MTEIPIKNLWLLMLYASNLFKIPNSPAKRFATEENPDDIPDLVAEILTRAIERRLLYNLSVEIDRHQDDLTRVRGRISHIRTQRRHLLQRGKIACSFDYFTTNTPNNLFVKDALNKLSRVVKDNDLKRRCRVGAAALERAGVVGGGSYTATYRTNRAPTPAARVSVDDRLMISAAELAFMIMLPTQESGDAYLPIVDINEYELRKLFEDAVRGFYQTVLGSEWDVCKKEIEWQVESPTEGLKRILPKMETDIVLDKKGAKGCVQPRIIIDTKFTGITVKNQYSNDRLKSIYLYQIYAYLRSQEKEDDLPSLTASGMLLYPSLENNVDESAIIQGHKMRFVTVNLAEDAASIRDRLLYLIASQ